MKAACRIDPDVPGEIVPLTGLGISDGHAEAIETLAMQVAVDQQDALANTGEGKSEADSHRGFTLPRSSGGDCQRAEIIPVCRFVDLRRNPMECHGCQQSFW